MSLSVCFHSISKALAISHVLNEQGTGYKYLKSIELKNGSFHLKEHPKLSTFVEFQSYWFQGQGMVHFQKGLSMDWMNSCSSNSY